MTYDQLIKKYPKGLPDFWPNFEFGDDEEAERIAGALLDPAELIMETTDAGSAEYVNDVMGETYVVHRSMSLRVPIGTTTLDFNLALCDLLGVQLVVRNAVTDEAQSWK